MVKLAELAGRSLVGNDGVGDRVVIVGEEGVTRGQCAVGLAQNQRADARGVADPLNGFARAAAMSKPPPPLVDHTELVLRRGQPQATRAVPSRAFYEGFHRVHGSRAAVALNSPSTFPHNDGGGQIGQADLNRVPAAAPRPKTDAEPVSPLGAVTRTESFDRSPCVRVTSSCTPLADSRPSSTTRQVYVTPDIAVVAVVRTPVYVRGAQRGPVAFRAQPHRPDRHSRKGRQHALNHRNGRRTVFPQPR